MVIRSVGSITTAARKIQFSVNFMLFTQILIQAIKPKSYFTLYNIYKPELYINKTDIFEER